MLSRTRRAAWLALALVSFAVAVAPGQIRAQEAQPDTGPNILLIVTDDQRVDTMNIMRRTREWMGKGGVRYPQAYVTTPMCCPSRATIFSGRYAHNHGVNNNDQALELNADLTLQAYLKAAGYRTAMAGKYLNKFDVNTRPLHFHRYAMRENRPYYWGARWNVQGVVKKLPDYDTHIVARQGLRYLKAFERADKKPWFIYLAPLAPHGPSSPESKYAEAHVPFGPQTPSMHEDDLSDKPEFIQESPQRVGKTIARTVRRQYRAMLSVDDMVHALMRRLKELGETRRTLVIFTSDNGYLWRDHGLYGKALPYIPSVKVPLYLRWPGRVTAGSLDRRLVANVDLAPTILDAAGVQPAVPMDGRSLLDRTWTRDRIFVEHDAWNHPAWNALVFRDTLYVEWATEQGTLQEYYDLASDPWELNNLFGDADPSNDPITGPMSAQIQLDSTCAGTDGLSGGSPPCP
jgi:arylsulfatase A-like enzyme